VADLSIYVARGWRGKGIGRVLLAETITRTRGLGYHKVMLAALAANAPGAALYTRSGRSRVGAYREQGLLGGRWTDVLVMEQLL
jgi:phosphinothricin acetyltransferase